MKKTENALFVYAKDGIVKVYDLQTSLLLKDKMKIEGWKHTATLDSIAFIEHLVNCKDEKYIIETVINLRK